MPRLSDEHHVSTENRGVRGRTVVFVEGCLKELAILVKGGHWTRGKTTPHIKKKGAQDVSIAEKRR